MARAIVTISFIVAILRAVQQRTVEPRVTGRARASHVGRAHTIAGAIVGADTLFTFRSFVARLALAVAIVTQTMIIAIAWARFQAAVFACPFRLTPARPVEANTVTGAISRACS